MGCGYANMILKTTDGGANWFPQNCGTTFSTLNCVHLLILIPAGLLGIL